MSCLCSMEKKLNNNEFLQSEYQKTIDMYIEKGYLKRVSKDEEPPPEVWYLPRYPVLRMHKTSTKVPIVVDSAAKPNGISLNDVIHSGPISQPANQVRSHLSQTTYQVLSPISQPLSTPRRNSIVEFEIVCKAEISPLH